jgi:hypothetical protein
VEGKKSCVGLAIFKNHWTVAINNQFWENLPICSRFYLHPL